VFALVSLVVGEVRLGVFDEIDELGRHRKESSESAEEQRWYHHVELPGDNPHGNNALVCFAC
jgi:hypothetical protein